MIKRRAFCFGNEIGVVTGKIFEPIELNKMKFMRIIAKLMNTNKYSSPDVLLKEAIKEYTACDTLARVYQQKNLSDSELFMRWRKRIKNHSHFQEKAKPIKEANDKLRQMVKEERRKYSIDRNEQFYSVARTLKRNGKTIAAR